MKIRKLQQQKKSPQKQQRKRKYSNAKLHNPFYVFVKETLLNGLFALHHAGANHHIAVKI